MNYCPVSQQIKNQIRRLTMFGPKMYIEMEIEGKDHHVRGVLLRPVEEHEMDAIAEHFSSLSLHQGTMQRFGVVAKDEREWWEKVRKDRDTVTWGIVPDGSDVVVGVTAVHHLTVFGAARTGIIIANKEWHGKGVATRTHLLRTLYAADYLARVVMHSSARTHNIPSIKALQGVGYKITGRSDRDDYRAGKYVDTYHLTWLHPEKTHVTYPASEGGLPEEYAESVEIAQEALERARKFVQLP
jgi:RimJ/RimL family protein N-acetyltransferase